MATADQPYVLIRSFGWPRTEARCLKTRPSLQPGFTLIELIVVMAIIAVLIAILLNAITYAREAARRVVCQNHLRQLGLAAVEYEVAKHGLPPSLSSLPARHTWFAFILPFIEEQAVFDRIDFHHDWAEEINLPAIQTPIGVLHCPSTPDGDRVAYLGLGGPGESHPYLAVTDYSAPTYVAWTQRFPGASRRDLRGALDSGRQVRLAEVTDGISHTLLAVEDAGRPAHWLSNGLGPENSRTGCENYDVVGGQTRGAGWDDPTNIIPFHGFRYDGIRCPGPCAINCTNNNEAFGFHGGGVVAVFLDDSVRFLNEQMEARVYAAAITRAAAAKEGW